MGIENALGREDGVVRCELNVAGCQLGRLARPPQRRHSAECFELLVGCAAADLQGRSDRARVDAVHADAILAELLGDTT